MKYSVIIPVHNNLEYTKCCIQDLFSSNIAGLECIVIDNASTDDTKDYLISLDSKIKIITNEENLGCSRSWNQGIKNSKGDWVIILNNDVRLSSGWLRSLIDAAVEKNLQVVSPAMREGPLNYNFDLYASSYTETMKNICRKWTPIGVCFAVKREVFKKVGLFDENYEIGQYEDADFFRRCKLNNISMGITGSSFIHHFGSSTQSILKSSLKYDYAKQNQLYHRKKWGIGFIRKLTERFTEQILVKFWSRREYFFHKHSLIEKFERGRVSYH